MQPVYNTIYVLLQLTIGSLLPKKTPVSINEYCTMILFQISNY